MQHDFVLSFIPVSSKCSDLPVHEFGWPLPQVDDRHSADENIHRYAILHRISYQVGIRKRTTGNNNKTLMIKINAINA